MKSNEFDAVYATTDLFAIAPYTVAQEVPSHLQRQKLPYQRGFSCPIGLVKAKVVDTKTVWHSMESFGCGPGASTHEVAHRNGVLVEIGAKDAEEAGLKARPYVVKTTTGFTMVITKKACVMPWSDYQPVRDARRKQQRESERRSQRMSAAIQAVGGTHGHWHEYKVNNQGDYVFDDRRAAVDVPLLVVEQIAGVLAATEADPAMVPMLLDSLKDTIGQMPAMREAVNEAMEGGKKKRRAAKKK